MSLSSLTSATESNTRDHIIKRPGKASSQYAGDTSPDPSNSTYRNPTISAPSTRTHCQKTYLVIPCLPRDQKSPSTMSVDLNSPCSGAADCVATATSHATEVEHWEIFTFLGLLASSVLCIVVGVVVAKRRRRRASKSDEGVPGREEQDLEKNDPRPRAPGGATAVPETATWCGMLFDNTAGREEAMDRGQPIVVKKVRFDLQQRPPCPGSSSAQAAGTVVQSSQSVARSA